MQIRQIILLTFMISNLTHAGYAQIVQDSTGFELRQELNTIKQELIRKGEISSNNQDTEQLMQKITELSKKLETAENKIKTIQLELETKNNEQNPKSSELVDVGFWRKDSKDQQVLDLTNKVKELEIKLNNYKSSNMSDFAGIANNSDYKRQLDTSTDTIVEQTRQLSKAYEEIDKLKRNSISGDKLTDSIILQAEKLHLQGQTQEAIAIYEILDKLEVRKPKIYQNLAVIYQGLGMNSEAEKQYDKFYLLFPNLKGDVKINRQKR